MCWQCSPAQDGSIRNAMDCHLTSLCHTTVLGIAVSAIMIHGHCIHVHCIIGCTDLSDSNRLQPGQHHCQDQQGSKQLSDTFAHAGHDTETDTEIQELWPQSPFFSVLKLHSASQAICCISELLSAITTAKRHEPICSRHDLRGDSPCLRVLPLLF